MSEVTYTDAQSISLCYSLSLKTVVYLSYCLTQDRDIIVLEVRTARGASIH